MKRSTTALVVAFCSSFIPGSGHALVGRWRRGLLLLGSVLAVLGVAAGVVLRPADSVFQLLVQPRVLRSLLGINAVLLVLRLMAVLDAYRLARVPDPGRRSRFVTSSVLGLVLIITATPHVAAGYYTYEAYSLLTTVFAAHDQVVRPTPPAATLSRATVTSRPTPTTTPPSTPTVASPPIPTPAQPGRAPTPQPTAPPSATPLPTAPPAPVITSTPDPWHGRGRINILLLGADAGPERTGLRTDTMMVASIDPQTQQAALFGLPRDLKYVPLPAPAAEQFHCRCWAQRLNALYSYGEQHPELFPASEHPGAAALQATIGTLLGIEIDHYAMVDLGGFVDVIDALGGVTVTIPEAMQIRVSPAKPGDAWHTYRIAAGRQHLDGRTALAYVRNRSDASDYTRMQRQRCLLTSIAQEADPAGLLGAFPRLAQVIKERVVTDIPLSVLPDLMTLATSIDAGAIKQVGFTPPHYAAGYTADEYPNPIPNVPLIQQTVQTIVAAPAATEDAAASATPSVIETAAESCGWTE